MILQGWHDQSLFVSKLFGDDMTIIFLIGIRPSRYVFFQLIVNEEDNQKAVDQLNGKELDGRTITVNLARPREDKPRRDFNNDRGGERGGGSFRQRSW